MDTSMPWTGGSDEEYATQHFGFGPQTLKEAIRQMIQEKIRNGFKDMEQSLQESLDLNETDKKTMTHFCNEIVSLYISRSGPPLAIIDNEIDQLLTVPAHVLLKEDEVQLEQISDEDFNTLKNEVVNLRKRVERGALMKTLLAAEEKELSSAEKVCERAKKDMQVLDLLHKKFKDSENLEAMQQDTSFLCNKVPFLNTGDNLFDD